MGAKVLSDERVRELRTRCVVNGESIAALAREFGVSKSHARLLAMGYYRIAAGGPLHEPGQPRPALRAESAVTGLNDEDQALALRLLADGATPENTAAVMMCPLSEIERLLEGR